MCAACTGRCAWHSSTITARSFVHSLGITCNVVWNTIKKSYYIYCLLANNLYNYCTKKTHSRWCWKNGKIPVIGVSPIIAATCCSKGVSPGNSATPSSGVETVMVSCFFFFFFTSTLISENWWSGTVRLSKRTLLSASATLCHYMNFLLLLMPQPKAPNIFFFLALIYVCETISHLLKIFISPCALAIYMTDYLRKPMFG